MLRIDLLVARAERDAHLPEDKVLDDLVNYKMIIMK